MITFWWLLMQPRFALLPTGPTEHPLLLIVPKQGEMRHRGQKKAEWSQGQSVPRHSSYNWWALGRRMTPGPCRAGVGERSLAKSPREETSHGQPSYRSIHVNSREHEQALNSLLTASEGSQSTSIKRKAAQWPGERPQLPGTRGIFLDHVTFMCPWLVSVQLKNTVRGAS